MARFNEPTATKRVVNRAGGEAFDQPTEMKLVSLLLTSFVKNQYYRTADQQLDEIVQLVQAIPDKRFAAQAAVFARNEFGMRSITHALAGEIGATVKGQQWTKDFFNAIARRPDDVTEILAYYMGKHGKIVPNAMKKGLGQALTRYDAYQLAKYQGKGKSVSLVDAVNLCHPKHTEQLGMLVAGKLAPANTWETKLTQAGQQAEDADDLAERKSQAWGELIASRKLGYFALLRNLRNILQQAPESLDSAVDMLVDERLIRRSLVMPFRYIVALKEFRSLSGDARKVILALSRAVDISLANVPDFPGNTLICVDVSGSMQRGGQTATPAEIASLFAAALYKANNADLMLFTTDAKYFSPNPADSTLTIADRIISNAIPRGTNFHAPIQLANKAYDRIIFLSDMQGWINYNAPTGTLAQYERKCGVRPSIYSFDLAGYGDMQFPADRVLCLAGFSEKTFEVMALLEQDKNALINKIKAVEF